MSEAKPGDFGFGPKKTDMLSINTYFHTLRLKKKFVKIIQKIQILLGYLYRF